MFRRTPIATAVNLAILANAIGTASPVLAQTPEYEDPSRALDDTVEEIIVTGTRIAKDIYSSALPVDVLYVDDAQLAGVSDIAEMVHRSPIALGSAQQTAVESSYTGWANQGGFGVSTLSLRGIGANRTLVLLNGRRAGPAGTRGQVSSFDLGVLPITAIERVEILKDGSSSIYGSDAIAGVVNFITRKGDGLSVDAFTSQPGESGGEAQRLSASWGKTFSEGSFRVTGAYHRNRELEEGDRDYLDCGEQYIFDPETGERADAIDPRTGEISCGNMLWGQVWLYDYQGPGGNVPQGALAQYDYDGDLGEYLDPITADPDNPFALRTPPGWYLVNYDKYTQGIANWDHPFYSKGSVTPEVERATVYAEGEFDLMESVQLYAEALFDRRETTMDGYRQFWGYIYNEDFFGGNPLSEGWTGAQWLSPTSVTDHWGQTDEVEYQRYVAGLRGDISPEWSFDVSAQYSKSVGDYMAKIIYGDSIGDQDFLHDSCQGMTTSVRGVPCQDIPWLNPEFLAGNVSPEMREFLFGQAGGETDYTQFSAEAFVTGDLWELPAGPLAAAFGVHYRDDEIDDVPGEIWQVGNVWGSVSYGITQGSAASWAVFGELDIPLLANKPGFELLNLNVSGRYTDVDFYGGETTYKASLNWQATPAVRLRANHATSFRTPALYEQFLDGARGWVYWRAMQSLDPCIDWGAKLQRADITQRIAVNCAATVTDRYPDGLPLDYAGPSGYVVAARSFTGGRDVLEPETGESTTGGFIWTPDFADLSVALDYFTFTVNDQVDQIGLEGIVHLCYDSEFFPEDPICSYFDRSGDNSGLNNLQDVYINVAEQKNRGWDLSIRYATDLGGGDLVLETRHNYQKEAVTALFEETARDTNGQFGEPKWVGNFSASWSKSDWDLHYGLQYIDEVSNVENFDDGESGYYWDEPIRYVMSAGSVVYHNLSAGKSWDNGVSLRLGLSNLLDEEPPVISAVRGLNMIANSARYPQYDLYGRRLWLNLMYSVR